MTKVLIVDDAEANRKILSALLARAGYETVVAANADEARRLFAEERPSHVITDMRMPGETGTELARALRELAGERGVRIALASGDDAAEAADCFDVTLGKPVTVDELRKFLEGGGT